MEPSQYTPTTRSGPPPPPAPHTQVNYPTSPATSSVELSSIPGLSLLRARKSLAALNADLPSSETPPVPLPAAGILQFFRPERGPGRNPYFNKWTALQRKAQKKAYVKGDKTKKKTLSAAYYFNTVLGVGPRYRHVRVRAIFIYNYDIPSANGQLWQSAGPSHRNYIWAR